MRGSIVVPCNTVPTGGFLRHYEQCLRASFSHTYSPSATGTKAGRTECASVELVERTHNLRMWWG